MLAIPAIAAAASTALGSGALAAIATGAGSLLAAKMLKKSQAPAALPTPQAPPTPQAAKTVDRSKALAGNTAAAMAGGGMSGNSGTFLTGPGGVDPTTLNLGKNTLLGQ